MVSQWICSMLTYSSTTRVNRNLMSLIGLSTYFLCMLSCINRMQSDRKNATNCVKLIGWLCSGYFINQLGANTTWTNEASILTKPWIVNLVSEKRGSINSIPFLWIVFASNAPGTIRGSQRGYSLSFKVLEALLFFCSKILFLEYLHTSPTPATVNWNMRLPTAYVTPLCHNYNLPIWSKSLGGWSEVESSVFLLCSFSDQLRERMRGDLRRRTAPGKSVRYGGQRGCRCVHHRLHSPTGHGQTPTGKVYHLERYEDTQAQRNPQTEWVMSALRTLTRVHTQM